MLELSPKTNLLEENDYRYSLQDVKDPILYRDVYNYDEVPKVAFNHRRVPMCDARGYLDHRHHLPRRPAVDESLHARSDRGAVQADEQAGRTLRPSSGRPSSSSTASATARRSSSCHGAGPALPGDHDLDSRQPGRLPRWSRIWASSETGILVSCSDYHIFKKLKMTRRAGHGALPGRGQGRV